MQSSKFAETINGRVQVREASWKACAPLNVPATGSQHGGVTSNRILTERGEIEIGVTLHPITRYIVHR